MPTTERRLNVQFPPETEALIRETQAQLAAEGLHMTVGLVARYLIGLGHEARTRNAARHVSSN